MEADAKGSRIMTNHRSESAILQDIRLAVMKAYKPERIYLGSNQRAAIYATRDNYFRMGMAINEEPQRLLGYPVYWVNTPDHLYIVEGSKPYTTSLRILEDQPNKKVDPSIES